MALPVQRSLPHLRDAVRAACGFSVANATGAAKGLAADWVRKAEEEIYQELEFRPLKTETAINTVIGQTLYDWPDGVDLSRTISLQVKYGDDWTPVRPKGIEWYHDTVSGEQGFPLIYDDGPQLEVWPEPDAVYEMRLEHYARPRVLRDPAAWVGGTTYALGDFVVPATGVLAWPTPLPITAHVSHFVYECTVAGAAHASTEPTWPTTSGGTVTDNAVTWTARLNTTVVPSTLVERLAVYKAKLHYRQPDAEESMGSYQLLLSNVKKGQQVDRRYVQPVGRARRRRADQDLPWVPPKRV